MITLFLIDNSSSLKNIKAKKSYGSNAKENKLIQGEIPHKKNSKLIKVDLIVYPQSTTNKENKAFEFDSHLYGK